MVGKIIREYLEAGNKKVTVPGFGTFMRKDSGEIIFVDLIRKDDGLLRELVEDYGHYSDVEAMAIVDRFIFEVKHGIERSGSAAIEGFGTMTLDDKGLYQFNHPQQTTEDKPVRPQDAPVRENTEKVQPTPRPAAQKPVIRPSATPQTSAQKKPAGHAPVKGKRRKKEKLSKPDMLILIAVAAAVIALIVIVYGMSGAGFPFLK